MRWGWRHLRPPAGIQVRRLVVLLSLAISLPRLILPIGPVFSIPRPPIGWSFLVLAALLALTCWRWRLYWLGRTIAAIGFAMFVTLAFDSWPSSQVSALISLGIAYALLGEASTHVET